MSQSPKLNILDEANPQLLNEFSNDDFAKIRDRFEESETVITLCLPMEKAGAETRKNHIVFKNAVTEAKERLSERGDENRELEFALRDLMALDDATAEFWQHQADGLVMIVDGGDDVICIRLPYPVGPSTHVADSPYLRPLHRLANPSRYYVLALDLNELKLYEATRWNLREIELDNVPTSLDEAMKYDDPEESLQFRSSTASSGKGGNDPIYHGHGTTTDATENEKIKRYFEMVSKDIDSNFPDREAQLILLGPGGERARYREVNHYEKLCEHEIDLNPSNRSHDDLAEIVGEHIEKLGASNVSERLERLQTGIANNTGSTDLKEITKALLAGKVDTLFYQSGTSCYGKVSPETFEAEIHDEPKKGDIELIDFCAARSIDTGAEVCVLESDAHKLPDDSSVAAVYRY